MPNSRLLVLPFLKTFQLEPFESGEHDAPERNVVAIEEVALPMLYRMKRYYFVRPLSDLATFLRVAGEVRGRLPPLIMPAPRPLCFCDGPAPLASMDTATLCARINEGAQDADHLQQLFGDEPIDYYPGDRVVLSSVPSWPELVGKRGWIIDLAENDGDYVVEVDGGGSLVLNGSCLSDSF